jgi:GT2 family glycosyltransferase
MRDSERSYDSDGSEEPPAESFSDDLTVVVVDWNLPDHTIRCVRSLIAVGVPADRIVVVENGPTDVNWAHITAELSSCILVRVDTNVGFAAANNIGARLLPGHAYLLANNDAFVHGADSISQLLKSLDQDGIGIAVPRLLNADLSLQPSVAPFTTPLVALVRASGLSRFIPNRWQPKLSTHWDHASSREVETAIGAVMLVDAQAWERLAGLRETSFMYSEDLDLCWRLREEGWKTWFCSEAEFVHLGGTSSDRRWSPRERSRRIGQAEARMIQEHLRPSKAAMTLTLMRLGLAVRVVYFRLVRNEVAAESCRGSLEGLRRAPTRERTDKPPSLPAIDVIRPSG